MLDIRGLSAGYRGRPVIHDLSLGGIADGEVISLVGPNAAGKSTLLRALAGLIPAAGSVEIEGMDLFGETAARRSHYVSYMPQGLPQGVGLSVLESVLSAADVASADMRPKDGKPALERAVATLAQVGIADIALEPLSHLSGGQRQLVSLAQVLVRAPRVLLLDEPISALDMRFQLSVMRIVQDLARSRGAIVIMVLHDLSIAARWSDRIAVLSRGAVAAFGPPLEAVTPEILAAVYGIRARVELDGDGRPRILVDDTL